MKNKKKNIEPIACRAPLRVYNELRNHGEQIGDYDTRTYLHNAQHHTTKPITTKYILKPTDNESRDHV